MMGAYIRFMIGIVVMYLTPLLIIVMFSRPIKRHFASRNIPLKAADLLVPFLLLGIHLFSQRLTEQSYVPYFFLFVFSFGIFLASWIYYKKKELYFNHFFRTW